MTEMVGAQERRITTQNRDMDRGEKKIMGDRNLSTHDTGKVGSMTTNLEKEIQEILEILETPETTETQGTEGTQGLTAIAMSTMTMTTMTVMTTTADHPMQNPLPPTSNTLGMTTARRSRNPLLQYPSMPSLQIRQSSVRTRNPSSGSMLKQTRILSIQDIR